MSKRTRIKPHDIADYGPSVAGLVLATDGDGNFVLVPQEGGGGGGGAGIMGWDEGVPLQTGTILNVVGPNADFSISGTVLRLFVTGTVGGGNGGGGTPVSVQTGTIKALELIEEVILDSDGSFDISVSGTNYKNLYMVGSLRSDVAATADAGMLRFNGDTGNNYDCVIRAVNADNSDTGSGDDGPNVSHIRLFTAGNTSVPSNAFTPFHTHIPDYNGLRYKGVVGQGYYEDAVAAGSMWLVQFGGIWKSLDPIYSIQLVPEVGTDWVSGSAVRIYGEVEQVVVTSVEGGFVPVPFSIQTGTLFVEETIFEETLISPTGSMNFPGIPQNYDHIKIRVTSRSTHSSGDWDRVLLYYNGDTGSANYRYAAQWGGTAEGGGVDDFPLVAFIPNANSDAGVFGQHEIDIFDYRVTGTQPNFISQGGNRRSSTNIYVETNYVQYEKYVSVNEILLDAQNAMFASGTHVQIIGVRESVVITSVEGDMAPGTVVVYDEDTELGSFGQMRFKGDGVDAYNSGTYAAVSVPGAFPSQCFAVQIEGMPSSGTNAPAYNTSQILSFYGLNNPGADGHEIVWNIPLEEGTYEHYVIGFKASTRAILDWYIDGTAVITGQDWYDAGSIFNQAYTNSGITVSGSQTHEIKCKINGRNASSSGWIISTTFFTMRRTGD